MAHVTPPSQVHHLLARPRRHRPWSSLSRILYARIVAGSLPGRRWHLVLQPQRLPSYNRALTCPGGRPHAGRSAGSPAVVPGEERACQRGRGLLDMPKALAERERIADERPDTVYFSRKCRVELIDYSICSQVSLLIMCPILCREVWKRSASSL